MRLPCKFQLGARVWHRCDPDAGRGIITAISFSIGGGHWFNVRWDAHRQEDHYEAELTTVKELDFGGGESGGDSDPPEEETAEKP